MLWVINIAFLNLLSCVPAKINTPEHRFEYSELHMGVQARLVLYTSSEVSAKTAAKAAFEEANRLNLIFSDYEPESELSRMSKMAYPEAFQISEELLDVLILSKKFYDLSEGSFDVSAGSLTQLWRRSRREKSLPSGSALQDAKERLGMNSIRLDREASMVLLDKPNMVFDLGGVAKGYAAAKMLGILRAFGCPQSMIEFGGELALGEAPPDSDGWKIDIQGKAYEIQDVFVSSSGSDFQFVEIDGVQYSHVLDTKTGLGLPFHHSLSVIHGNGPEADALSTTLSLIPKEKWSIFNSLFPDLIILSGQTEKSL